MALLVRKVRQPRAPEHPAFARLRRRWFIFANLTGAPPSDIIFYIVFLGGRGRRAGENGEREGIGGGCEPAAQLREVPWQREIQGQALSGLSGREVVGHPDVRESAAHTQAGEARTRRLEGGRHEADAPAVEPREVGGKSDILSCRAPRAMLAALFYLFLCEDEP